MRNMSYCRMENTYNDLRDCYINWEEAETLSEKMYRNDILNLCKKIIEEYEEVED